MFQGGFSAYALPGSDHVLTCEVGGFTLTARLEDDHGDPPWEREDGHGPVSDWTSRPKRPGEWVLCSDRFSHRYYDAQAATEQAKAESWGPRDVYTWATLAERAAIAVREDFEVLRAWCNDEWFYVGVVVSVSRNGIVLDDHAASLWGTECNYPFSDNSYLTEVANDLIPEALDAAQTALTHMLERLK